MKPFYKHYVYFTAFRTYENWLELHDLIPLENFSDKRGALKAYRELEKDISSDGKLIGWLTFMRPTQTVAMKTIVKLGALPYKKDNDYIYFVRRV